MTNHKYLRIKQPTGQVDELNQFIIDIHLFVCDGVKLCDFTIYTEYIKHGFKSYYEYDFSTYKQLAEHLDKSIYKLSNVYKFPYLDNREYIYNQLLLIAKDY